MCKTKSATQATQPTLKPRISATFSSSTFSATSSAAAANYSGNSSYDNFSTASSSASLKSFKSSLPEMPVIYAISEISSAAATARRLSSSSTRCSLRSKDAVVVHRKTRVPLALHDLQTALATLSRSHHTSLIPLLGAALSGPTHLYLVYPFLEGPTLSHCLRNPNNPSFTVLSTWLSRLQVATDVAHGLEYIHSCSGIVHNRLKSSSIIVTPALNARICHFGTAELTGESRAEGGGGGAKKVEGTRGYMAPEVMVSGDVSQKSDVYAFGVVMLELMSGEEALKYRMDEGTGGGYRRVSVIDTAREAAAGGGVRSWVDRRLKDSFPIEVAKKMVKMVLECVEEEAERRPEMGRVAGLVSKLFLESQKWAERIGLPVDISVSLAPR